MGRVYQKEGLLFYCNNLNRHTFFDKAIAVDPKKQISPSFVLRQIKSEILFKAIHNEQCVQCSVGSPRIQYVPVFATGGCPIHL